MSIRLVQLLRGVERRVALVDEPYLRLISGPLTSVLQLAKAALDAGRPLGDLVHANVSSQQLSYDEIYEGRSEWRLLPAADYPDNVWRLLISGTGLTHMASVKRRDAMHAAAAQETDSMRMYRWGVEGGKPARGIPGVAPEWFYKGNGTILRGCGDSLDVPPFAEDGGEEPEIAGVYLIDDRGVPRRLGMTIGNEFSDHRFEKRNYLYLAHSKLRTCAIGPELVIDAPFDHMQGEVRVERSGEVMWSSQIQSGENVMCHSLANMEHHHFKYPQHRVPGDLHIHFFGADAFSFGSGVDLEDGDVMQIAFAGFGRPLRNALRRCTESAVLWAAQAVAT